MLNGRAGVSETTRSRIEELLGAHNYSRRTTRHHPAPLIEVLCFEPESPFGGAAIAHLERLARAQGVGLVVSGTEDDHQPSAAWVDGVLHREPLGIVLIAAQLTDRVRSRLRSRDLPVVTIDPFGAPPADAPAIAADDWNGGYLATRHLLELGHTRIAIITGPDDMSASTSRRQGYRTALDTAGIRVRPEWIRPGSFTHHDGFEQGVALLSLSEPPTAIFASSDVQALGVYDAARSLGLGIPDDVSIVGHDDLAIAQWAGPAMTTVHVPLAEMVEQAVSLITRLPDEPALGSRRVDVSTSLVVRESTAPPRGML